MRLNSDFEAIDMMLDEEVEELDSWTLEETDGVGLDGLRVTYDIDGGQQLV